MLAITVIKRVNMSKVVLLGVMILAIVAAVSAEDTPSSEHNHSSNLSPSNSSSAQRSKNPPGENSSMTAHDSSVSDAAMSKVSSTGNATKSGCTTEPCKPDSSDTLDHQKTPSSNASLPFSHQDVTPHTDDPSADMNKKLNPEALMRGFYVFAGLSVIVMIYIGWRSFGKRPTQVHRYGVVANREDLEMAPLDSDEGEGDEDDTTHFDLSKHRLK